jgi:hypothetical protein
VEANLPAKTSIQVAINSQFVFLKIERDMVSNIGSRPLILDIHWVTSPFIPNEIQVPDQLLVLTPITGLNINSEAYLSYIGPIRL